MADAGKLGAASPLLTVFGVASTDQSQALPAVAASLLVQPAMTPQLAEGAPKAMATLFSMVS